jgi:hypothetical protein
MITFNRIKKITYWCLAHKFETLLILSVLIILILALSRITSTGTWSDSYYYLPNIRDQISTITSAPPRKDSNGELRARAFLESYFKQSFPKSRPDFMVNQVTGSRYNLELDCYNSELRLAVEYNGQQHYNYIPFFHKNKEAFYNQKYRDEIKRIRCKELGIILIEIPYTEEKRLEKFLEQQLKIAGF